MHVIARVRSASAAMHPAPEAIPYVSASYVSMSNEPTTLLINEALVCDLGNIALSATPSSRRCQRYRIPASVIHALLSSPLTIIADSRTLLISDLRIDIERSTALE